MAHDVGRVAGKEKHVSKLSNSPLRDVTLGVSSGSKLLPKFFRGARRTNIWCHATCTSQSARNWRDVDIDCRRSVGDRRKEVFKVLARVLILAVFVRVCTREEWASTKRKVSPNGQVRWSQSVRRLVSFLWEEAKVGAVHGRKQVGGQSLSR